MSRAGLDAVILEVGLGGRLDATNIIDPDCAIITSIDLDHMDCWAPTAKASAARRPASCARGRPVVVSDRCPPKRAGPCAEVDADLALGAITTRATNSSGAGPGAGEGTAGLAYPALRGANQLINASGRAGSAYGLRERLPVTAQAVRNGLAWSNCRGASRSCRASRRWCWTSRTTRIRWPRSRPTWTPWAFPPPRMRCSAPWPTRIWPHDPGTAWTR